MRITQKFLTIQRALLFVLLAWLLLPIGTSKARVDIPPIFTEATSKCSTEDGTLFIESEPVDPDDLPIDVIEFIFLPGHNTANRVRGKALPDSDITFQLYFSGSLVDVLRTHSDSNGFYNIKISPNLYHCPTGYAILFTDNAQVIMKIGDQIWITHSWNPSISVDVLNNEVSGYGYFGLPVYVTVTEEIGGTCEDPIFSSISAQSLVNISRKFLFALEDFGGQATARVRLYDGPGVSIQDKAADYIVLDIGKQTLNGRIKWYGVATYSLTRGEQLLESKNFNINNYLSIDFENELAPGDIIEVRSGVKILYKSTVAPMDAQIDLENNLVSGQSLPENKLLISDRRFIFANWSFSNPCATGMSSPNCITVTANGKYNFSPQQPLRPGDSIYLSIIDANGNLQVQKFFSGPALFIGRDNNPTVYIFGSLPQGIPYQTPIMVRLRDSLGDVIWEGYTELNDEHEFAISFIDEFPVDSIHLLEVSDGNSTESLFVPHISLNQLSGSNLVSGNAPAGNIFAARFTNGIGATGAIFCQEEVVQDGQFSMLLDEKPNTSLDEYFVTHHNGQGGYFSNRYYVMGMIVQKDTLAPWVSVVVENPDRQVTLFHRRGVHLVGSYTELVTSPGYANIRFDAESSLLEGDILSMDTDDGKHTEIAIPELHAALDPASGLIIGRAPANEIVSATISREFNGVESLGTYSAVTNPTGDFIVPLPIGELRRDPDCRTFQIDTCTYFDLYYTSPQGNIVTWNSPRPTGVTQDIYEPDQTMGTASLYSVPQHHTILTLDDVEWVRVDISPLEIDKSFMISIKDMGWDMQLAITIFDGSAFSTYHTISEQGPNEFSVSFNKAGPSYLKIEPMLAGDFKPGTCDSAFTLAIERPQISTLYLPVIMQ